MDRISHTVLLGHHHFAEFYNPFLTGLLAVPTAEIVVAKVAFLAVERDLTLGKVKIEDVLGFPLGIIPGPAPAKAAGVRVQEIAQPIQNLVLPVVGEVAVGPAIA